VLQLPVVPAEPPPAAGAPRPLGGTAEAPTPLAPRQSGRLRAPWPAGSPNPVDAGLGLRVNVCVLLNYL
jgi:hypothetical protein